MRRYHFVGKNEFGNWKVRNATTRNSSSKPREQEKEWRNRETSDERQIRFEQANSRKRTNTMTAKRRYWEHTNRNAPKKKLRKESAWIGNRAIALRAHTVIEATPKREAIRQPAASWRRWNISSENNERVTLIEQRRNQRQQYLHKDWFSYDRWRSSDRPYHSTVGSLTIATTYSHMIAGKFTRQCVLTDALCWICTASQVRFIHNSNGTGRESLFEPLFEPYLPDAVRMFFPLVYEGNNSNS